MTSTAQLVGFYNQIANDHDKPQVKRFKTIEEGRDKAYHLAWTLGLDEEAPGAGNTEEEATEAKPNGGKAKAPAKAKGKAAKPAKEKEPKEKAAKPAREDQEKGPLDTRVGTHKHKVVELLLASNGKGVGLKDLAKKVYGSEESLGNVKMVLKGVKKSCDENPRFKFSIDKETASLTKVR
jgi:hypothetical protein